MNDKPIEGLEIRNSEGADGKTLKQFYQACGFDNGRSPEQYRRAFANSIARIAFLNGEMVGAGRAITDGVRCAAMFDICVLPAHRRRGIGRMVVQSLLAVVPGQFAILSCTPDVHAFYAGLGFRPENGAMVIDG